MKSEQIKTLLDRLHAAKRELVMSAAGTKTMPSDNWLRKVADIEVAIGAIETAMADGRK